MTAPPSPPTTAASAWTPARITALLLLVVFLAFAAWWFLLRDAGAADDFTAIDVQAQGLQQQCFDAGLFYDQFGNCYRIDPATLEAADRPSAVVAATLAAPAKDGEAAAAGGSSAGSTGQANPSGGSSSSGGSTSFGGSSSGSTGQADPSGGSSSSGGSTSTGGSSTGQADPGGGTATQPTPAPSTPTTATPQPTPTAAPSPTPASTTIVASERSPWSFRWSPDVPPGGCGPDSRVNGELTEECQDYQRAYGNSSNFSCDHASNGSFFCEQTDGNRDMIVEGDVTLSSAQLVRYVPSGSNDAEMAGSTSQGSEPGVVCDMSGSYFEVINRSDGTTGSVEGSWSASRNTPGC